MRIGLVLPYSLSYYGGVQNHVLGLYNEFKKQGHQLKIFVPKAKLEENYKNKDIIFVGGAINFPLESTSSISFGLTVKGVSINNFFEKENFDILHFHNPTTPFLPWQILSASKTTNIATFHADLIDHKIYENYPLVLKSIYDYLLPKIHGFIAVSQSAKDSVVSVYPGAKVTIIPNGINPDDFLNGKPIKKFKDGKFNLLYVGRFDERKGIFYLLEAFSILKKKIPKKLRLILVGGGPQRWEIMIRLKELKIQKETVLTGEVKEERLPDYYKTADLFVAPATHGESFGLVLLEAMAAGCPIVAAANRGYKEVLKEIADYSLVPPRNSEALAEKISPLIKNQKLREKLRLWGINEIKKYSWEKISEKVLEFYKQILKNEGRLL